MTDRKQDKPHMDKLSQLAQTRTKWYEKGKPLRMSMVMEDLREDGLISFEADGFVYLTPAGFDLLYKTRDK